MSEDVKTGLDILRNILTGIYNLEAVIKLMAHNMSYFNDSWNRFDFFIVIIADLGLLGNWLFSNVTTLIDVLNIIKALRILRLLRLIRESRNLRVLVDSLLLILPPLTNVGALIFLMLFIYAVIGSTLFNGVIY